MSILISVVIFAIGMCAFISVIMYQEEEIKLTKEIVNEINETKNICKEINNSLDTMANELATVSNKLKENTVILTALNKLGGYDDDEI